MHTAEESSLKCSSERDNLLQVKNGVLLEVLAAIEYFRPEQVLIEQVNEAQCTDGGVYAAELQATLMHLGFQVLPP